MNSLEADAGRVVLALVPILVRGQVGRGADWSRPVADKGLVFHLKELNGLALVESKKLLGVCCFALDSVTSTAEFQAESQFVLALV